MISVIIPLKNKEVKRLEQIIKRLNHKLISEIIIVDYKSDTPFKLKQKQVKIIRYDKTDLWNKPHAINIGAKNCKSEYIMTMDADILLSPNFFDKAEKFLNKNNFIYTNKVKRIEKENLSDNWTKMLRLSKNWIKDANPINELENNATGGFQIFPKKFFEEIRGIDENLVYYGGMDNITIIEARRKGLNIIILNDTILHLEHKNLKEDNLPEEERELARFIRDDRYNLMYYILESGKVKNPYFYGEIKGPNDPMVKKYIKSFKNINPPLKENEFELPQNIKIMITVINNRDTLPEKFVQCLMELYNETSSIFPNTEIHYVKACSIDNMRNMAIEKAISLDFDYLVQLDTDHYYDNSFILKLIGRDKDFITGCTRRRTNPYLPTQYYKFKIPMMTEENFVYVDGKEGVIKIEASGPVGMLMKVSALKELNYPYYQTDYSYYQMGLKQTKEGSFHPFRRNSPLGNDYHFCRNLKENNFELWLDTSVDFPHMVTGRVDGIGKEDKIKSRIILD